MRTLWAMGVALVCYWLDQLGVTRTGLKVIGGLVAAFILGILTVVLTIS